MNHTTLAVAAILATAAVFTAVGASVLPQQQAFAHYGHHGHHNHNNNNEIKVDQSINQLNNCTDAFCSNEANNQVDIGR
jgi:hypothetical protein